MDATPERRCPVLNLKIRWKGKCPKHPRYNPEKQGATFRSGCAACAHLYAAYELIVKARSHMSSVEFLASVVDKGGQQ